MTKASRTTILEPATEPQEITLSEATTLRITSDLYNRLVADVMKEVLRDARAWLECEFGSTNPVLVVSFPGLEGVEFPLRELFSQEHREFPDPFLGTQSLKARDALIEIFENAIKQLRSINDDDYREFYSAEIGLDGTET